MHDNPLWAVDTLTDLFGYQHLDTLRILGEITGVKRSYEEAAEEMTWDIDQYAEKYL